MDYGTNGVVIHVTKRDGVSPLDNITMHEEASLRNPDGRFYFSVPYNVTDIQEVDYVILYCNNSPSEDPFIFVAKVEPESTSSSEDFLPKDAEKYSPRLWAKEKTNCWFLLSNLAKFVEVDQLNELNVSSAGKEIRFVDRIKTNMPLGWCYVRGALNV